MSPTTIDNPHNGAYIDDITKTGVVDISVDHTVRTKLFQDKLEKAPQSTAKSPKSCHFMPFPYNGHVW